VRSQGRRRFRDGGRSFRDPAYGQVEAGLEREYGVPGLAAVMARVRTRGERSNADQVSSAGARTVYQVIPSTRQLFIRRHGVDAWAGPENAARVAALHLIDSYRRTGSWDTAVREYQGGPNPRRRGRTNWEYWRRVME
jgi:soluble lytic murein transglycosylase-like protein